MYVVYQRTVPERADMVKYVAVRLKRLSDGVYAFRSTDKFKRKIIDSNIEVRDPAVKNIAEGLYERGLKFYVDGCRLYWFMVDDKNSLEDYRYLNEVEHVFDGEWFEQEKKRIRTFRGNRYVEACIGLVKGVAIKHQNRRIEYDVARFRAGAKI